jgi:hypothetical protein
VFRALLDGLVERGVVGFGGGDGLGEPDEQAAEGLALH